MSRTDRLIEAGMNRARVAAPLAVKHGANGPSLGRPVDTELVYRLPV